MYLYETAEGKLKIWELKEDEEKLRKYRIDELGGKDFPNARLYRLQSFRVQTIDVFQRGINSVCTERQLLASGYSFRGDASKAKLFDCEFSITDIDKKRELVNNYLNSNALNVGFVRYIKSNHDEYYIPTEKEFTMERVTARGPKLHVLNGILQLPESLYLLETFRSGNYMDWHVESMSGQFKAFNLSETPIKEFDLSELQELKKYEVADVSIAGIDNKVYNSAKILQKVREVNKIQSTEDE